MYPGGRKLTALLPLTALLIASSLVSCAGTSAQGPGPTPTRASSPRTCSSSDSACPNRFLPKHPVVLGDVNVAGFLTVDRLGNIYTGSDSHTLVKISPSGRLLATWDGLDTTAYSPDSAGQIALDSQGFVYVADPAANRVIKLTPDLHVASQWGSFAYGSRQMVEPVGVALDAGRNVYVTDARDGQIVKVSPLGVPLATWGKAGEFRAPTGIAVDKQGRIYVADTGHNRIVRLTSSGAETKIWTRYRRKGFQNPLSIALDPKNSLYISDVGNQRLVRYTTQNKHNTTWAVPGKTTYAGLGLAVGPRSTVYLSECPQGAKDMLGCRIVAVSGKGKPSAIWTSAGVKPPAAPTVHKIGGKVDVGGYSLSYQCWGEGSPTVVLDSGYGLTSSSWSVVLARAAQFTRVCSYDRAGLGQSDPRPATIPGTSMQVARELHALLTGARIDGPYVLVGHSWGGINMRSYTYLYPRDVAGMILLDASHEKQCSIPSWCPGPGTERLELKASASELDAAIHGAVKGSLGHIPLVVISRGLAANPCDAGCTQVETVWLELQNDLATASSDSVHVIASASDHNVQIRQPGLAVAAVREVVTAIRSSDNHLPSCGEPLTAFGGRCLS